MRKRFRPIRNLERALPGDARSLALEIRGPLVGQGHFENLDISQTALQLRDQAHSCRSSEFVKRLNRGDRILFEASTSLGS
jgi:hypothetical protein